MRFRYILFLIAVFILAVITAVYYENSYRYLVRYFFTLFQGEQIKFVGKDFRLFASPSVMVFFGLFAVGLMIFLREQNKSRRFFFSGLTVLLFFLTTLLTTYIDCTRYVMECTACPAGIRALNYNDIHYNTHLVISLVAGLLPSLFVFLKMKFYQRIKS